MLIRNAVLCLCLIFALALSALPQEVQPSSTPAFTKLLNFDGTNGSEPQAGLVQATDGNFYGTTTTGGASGNCSSYGCGTVFKITPEGKLTTLHSFDGTDGYLPWAGLVQATDGNFYGTTNQGGAHDDGTVFRITPTGTLITLHSFCAQANCADGDAPFAGLVQATGGNFYGTTTTGGADDDGTVFKITPEGKLTTLHSFDGNDGVNPLGLVQATDGNFYGTTSEGGADNDGTIFKITAEGTLTTLHSFDGTDGNGPVAGLVQATDGNFYGTTVFGGASDNCSDGCGTVFKITPEGKLTTLHSFDETDGSAPHGALVQATNGNFYGTTVGGGAHAYGTVFKITSEGALTTLHSFDSTDGRRPNALLQATNGNFYGTTNEGGTSSDCSAQTDGCGTVFSLSVGLGPFIETRPTSGAVGTAVEILGNDLTDASSVTFNGKEATFTVVSSTEIKTTVPSGATTCKVEVKTPSRTLVSNVAFRVP